MSPKACSDSSDRKRLNLRNCHRAWIERFREGPIYIISLSAFPTSPAFPTDLHQHHQLLADHASVRGAGCVLRCARNATFNLYTRCQCFVLFMDSAATYHRNHLILILLFLVARTQDPLCPSTIYAPSTVSCAHGDFDRHKPWAGAMDEPFSYHPPSESANTEDGEG